MLGPRIKAAREERGWSQYDLARLSGVSQSAIAKIETGARRRTSGDVLHKLAAALDTTVEVLLTGVPGEDITQPPVDLLRAAGYTAKLINDLVESWHRQPASFRSEVIARAKRRVKEAHDLNGAIL